MSSGWESLLPPLVAIILAIAFRRVIIPLATGVFVGAVLLTRQAEQSLWWSPITFLESMWVSVSSSSHLQALLFSLLLGAMVGVLEAGGGMRQLIARVSGRIKSRRGGQMMIAGSGLAIFFDDYANTLLVGGTMRTSADRYGISREKLAYLVDSTAAPMAGLSVVSTWAAIEISYMAEGLAGAGITDSAAAFEMFLASIPYRFYPWLALALVFLVARSGRDFGPMLDAEAKAFARHRESADTVDPEKHSDVDGEESSALWLAAVIPVVICLISVGGVLGLTGWFSPDRPDSGDRGWLPLFSDVLGNGDSYLALIVGGATGLLAALMLHRMIGRVGWPLLGAAAAKGAFHMMPAMAILWFAWALSAMTQPDQLDTAGFLAEILSDRLSPQWLPTVVFLLAGSMAFSTGTSWGTMGILTPLSISLALKLDPTGGPDGAIALATCGSVLAGAIFGDHCSPISDTTVLSSRASGCDHLAHVKTQFPYAMLVALVCIVAGTIPVAWGISPWICLLVQVLLIAGFLACFGKRPGLQSLADSTSEV